MPEDSKPMIRLCGISRRFGNALAVNELSLDIPRGQTLGLLGMNGAGKSSTLRMLMGLLKPDSGFITIEGKNVLSHGPELRKRIGYVPERPTAYSWMTVREVMAFCSRLNPHWHSNTAEELLAAFRLDHSKRVRSLSKGMATKLHLLLALAHRPTVLILDEPLSGLDPVVRDEFLEGTLAATCERDCTVVLSSHQVDDVERLADRIAILHQGRLVLEGRTEELLRSAARLRLVMDQHDMNVPMPQGLVRIVREHRTCTLTVARCTESIVHDLQSTAGILAVERATLSLAELFKDIVRGMEEGSNDNRAFDGGASTREVAC